MDGAELVIRRGDAAMGEDQPCALEIGHGLDAVQQDPLFLDLRAQLGSREVHVTERRSQDGDPLLM